MNDLNDFIKEINEINKIIKDKRKLVKSNLDIMRKNINTDTILNRKMKEIESQIYSIEILEKSWHKKVINAIGEFGLIFWRSNGKPRISKLYDVPENISFLML